MFVLRLLWIAVGFVGLIACGPESPSASTEEDAPTVRTEGPESDVVPRDTITLTGTLIDATCHARAEPNATAKCEGQFVERGYPVGLQTGRDHSTVWILVTVPQSLGDYLTATVRVTGRVRSDGVLIPHQMEVHNGATWTTVM